MIENELLAKLKEMENKQRLTEEEAADVEREHALLDEEIANLEQMLHLAQELGASRKQEEAKREEQHAKRKAMSEEKIQLDLEIAAEKPALEKSQSLLAEEKKRATKIEGWAASNNKFDMSESEASLEEKRAISESAESLLSKTAAENKVLRSQLHDRQREVEQSKRSSAAFQANIERQNAAKEELQQAFDKCKTESVEEFAQLDSLIAQENETGASLELEIDQHRRFAREKQANDEAAYRQLAREDKIVSYAFKALRKVKEAEAKAKGL
jgi:hypothetical protein